jgi:hypothetical protein
VAKLFNDQGGLERIRARVGLAKAKMPERIRVAHQHSSKHRSEILKSDLCGCFYCEKTFEPHEIVTWIDGQQTALCPKCGIDSVIGSASGLPIGGEFLHEMCEYWFSTT